MSKAIVPARNVTSNAETQAALAASVEIKRRSGIADQRIRKQEAALRIDIQLRQTMSMLAVGLLSATLTIAVGSPLLARDDGQSSAVSGAVTKKVADSKSRNPAQDSGSSSSKSSSPGDGSVVVRTPAAGDALRFDQPVPFGASPVRGQTLEQLANGEPLFPPIEGLPENLWKKTCATCHKWDKAKLCDQGASYVKSAKGAFRHQHPYGGPYKLALMRWASSGCK
jgi:hypothetical protein